jgi:hypothetical protein
MGGRQVRCLGPERTVLALCAHGTKERWSRLQLVTDVAETIRAHPDLDWRWLLGDAERMRRQRVVALGLALAHELLDAELPAEVGQRCAADPAIPRLVGQIRDGSGWPPHGTQAATYSWTVWNQRRDRAGYLRYVGRLLATPNENDTNFLPLPGPLQFVRYLIRPLRLLAQYRNPVRLAKAICEYF